MKLYVESLLPVDPATAWSIFESDTFRDRLEAKANLHSEVLETRDEGPVQIRRLKFTSRNELPAVVAKLLGASHLTYEQTNRFDPSRSRLDWTVKLPVMTDRVKVSGATTIEPHPQGSRRVVDGDVEVSVKLIGGQIEKAVVAEFERSMNRAVELARDLIRERAAT